MRTLCRLGTLGIVFTSLSLFLNSHHEYQHSSLSFQNVKKIASEICATLLNDTIDSIIIWNNNPSPLSFDPDFLETNCPPARLNIINSPENIYFEARYLACARARTRYCFIQDDDFLVHPNIIKSLVARIHETSMSSIHLQPADELLTSELRTIRIGNALHATFAWLGYGTIVTRAKVESFLKLLDQLEVSDEERKMADNYFTILSNEIPERWFDGGVPLGGGEPFTVGVEGEERNNRHILRAAELLEALSERNESEQNRLPYIAFPHLPTPIEVVSRAPCGGRVCLFETSIPLLPQNASASTQGSSPAMILSIEKIRREALGLTKQVNYIRHSPSNAVDGDRLTSFWSPENANEGEWVGINLMSTAYFPWADLVLLIDNQTEVILSNSVFEITNDTKTWSEYPAKRMCSDSGIIVEESNVWLRKCIFRVEDILMRSLRLRLPIKLDLKWRIYEIMLE